KGFLRPALKRQNLRLVTHALVESLILEGRRAIGVRFRGGSETLEAYADREVLLTAGAINSPKLLELSGIGNPDIVRGLGIEPVLASPGVGENLQDHLQIRTVFRVEGTKTLNTLYHSPLGKVSMALR